MEGARIETGTFLLARAEAEHAAAERKREAAVTKASAIATLAAALIAIVAAPALDAGAAPGGVDRWIMLLAILLFLAAIAAAAGALLVQVRPGERVSRRELDNWTTEEFQHAEVSKHAHDFIEMFVAATKSLRAANERADAWMNRAVAAVAGGLVVLTVAFVVEIA